MIACLASLLLDFRREQFISFEQLCFLYKKCVRLSRKYPILEKAKFPAVDITKLPLLTTTTSIAKGVVQELFNLAVNANTTLLINQLARDNFDEYLKVGTSLIAKL